MNKKNKSKKVNVKVTGENGQFDNKDNLKWEDLHKAYMDTTKSIISQQSLMVNFATINKDILNKDTKIREVITGYSKSVSDVANDVKTISEKHMKIGKDAKTGKNAILSYLKGVLKTEDDYTKYISIASGYLLAEENLMTLTNTVYLDVFSNLKMYDKKDVDILREVIAEGKQSITDTIDKAIKEGDKNGK